MSEADRATSGVQDTQSSTPAFREKSLAHATAWKYSRNYLKGAGSVIWLSAVALLIIVIGIVIWASFSSPYYLVSILTGGVLG